MTVVGLTGGIASGKSFAGGIFRRMGYPVIDADQLAREVVLPGSKGFREVAEAFPEAVSGSKIDRAKLGMIVFSDRAKRKTLEGIIHPLVHREFVRMKSLHEKDPLLVYEVPLLFENGIDREMDCVVVVDIPVTVQKERLIRRSGLSAGEADQRIHSQWTREKRNARADFILSGLLTEKGTEEEIALLVPKLLAMGQQRKKGAT